MTQGKKKKRAANRSIMLAKKIIIKDGGTVSGARGAPAHPTPAPAPPPRAPAAPPVAGPPSRVPGPGSAGFPARPGLRPPGPDLGEGPPARPHLPPSPPATLGAWPRPTCASAGDGMPGPASRGRAAEGPGAAPARPSARPYAAHRAPRAATSRGPVPAPSSRWFGVGARPREPAEVGCPRRRGRRGLGTCGPRWFLCLRVQPP